MNPISTLKKKVYYHDTDAGGIVYYARYLNFFEEGRTEYCEERGIDKKALTKQCVFFVVAHIDVRYKAPARYLDVVEVQTSVEKVERVSTVFLQKVVRDNKLLVEAKVTWICVNNDVRPVSIPENFKQLFK